MGIIFFILIKYLLSFSCYENKKKRDCIENLGQQIRDSGFIDLNTNELNNRIQEIKKYNKKNYDSEYKLQKIAPYLYVDIESD